LLTNEEEHKKFHNINDENINYRDSSHENSCDEINNSNDKYSCSDCVKNIKENLQIDASGVSKLKRQGHFVYQINYILTGNGKELTYFYFGDFRKELLPSNLLLIKILEDGATEKFIKITKKIYQ
jgi:hypothetical protein